MTIVPADSEHRSATHGKTQSSSALLGKRRAQKNTFPTPNGIPETVTVRQAAGLLHSSVRQVQNLMYSGALTYYKPSHNKVLISVDSIRALFATPANAAVLHD